MKTRYFYVLAMVMVCFGSIVSAATPTRPNGLTEEEWQMVLKFRESKVATSSAAAQVSPSATVNPSPSAVATPPKSIQSLANRAADQSWRNRFVLVYRNNTQRYIFGDDPSKNLELGTDLYVGDKDRFRSFLGAVRLRDSLDGIKGAYPVLDDRPGVLYNAAENVQAQEEDSPATLGWTRDEIADTETWKGKGVFYLPVAFIGNDANPLSSGFHLLGYRNNWNLFYPAVRYERDSSKDGTDSEINTLDFLVGVDMNFIPDDISVNDWIQDSLGNLAGVVRVAAGIRTNFDFEDASFLTEFSYQPVDKENALNAFLTKSKGGSLNAFLHKFILKGFGDVTQSRFVSSALGSQETVLPLGFEAGLAIRPGDITSYKLWRKLELSATYRGQWDVLNQGDYHGLLDVSLSLPFIEDQTSYAGWKVSYKKGDDLTNYDELDELSLGVEVKF